MKRAVVVVTLVTTIVLGLLTGFPVSHSASQSVGQNIIVQHEYAVPKAGFGEYNLSLSQPVKSGDLLVVGVVFASEDVGAVTDTLSNLFVGQNQSASDLGTAIWWSVSKSSGNDTIGVRSLDSAELVEVFEIAGANASTVGSGGGGGWSPGPGINAVAASQDIHDGNAFVLLIGGDDNGSGVSETCFPYGPIDNTPAQSPGFTIEPYCGTEVPFSGGLIFGEYGVGNDTGEYTCQPKGNGTSCSATGNGFTADLGVNPPLAGNVLGQVFYVDPTYSTPTQTATANGASTQPVSTRSPGSGTLVNPDGYAPYVVALVSAVAVIVAASLALLHRHGR